MVGRNILITGGSGFIGVHLVSELVERGYNVINLDIRPPIDRKNFDLWREIDVNSYEDILKIHTDHKFQGVVHLAAVASQDAKSLNEFQTNIQGTRNIIRLCANHPSIEKVIFTSTQYVNLPGITPPQSLYDYTPYGFYGESKLIGEHDVRAGLTTTNWTIVRPTAIWGKFHPVLVHGLWYQIYMKRYIHPYKDESIKPYGYVKNTCWQIAELLGNYATESRHETYYLADSLMTQREWVEAFCQHLGVSFHQVPKILIWGLSKIGDLLKLLNIDFPIYSSRYRNLLQHNPVDVDPIFQLLGKPKIPFSRGVIEVTNWLKEEFAHD